MPAYAYLRKSSVRDPAREVSYEVQEASVHALAARHGDDEALILLSDWDKSGRLGPDKRPGYATLLEAIKSGRATAIYSYSLSRLSRSVTELSRLVEDCDKRGIPVRLDKDSIDTSTASGRLTANVLGSVAQFEAEIASERVRGAYAAKLARGESVATTPFYGDGEGEDAGLVLAAFREASGYSGAARLLNAAKGERVTSQRGRLIGYGYGITPRNAKPRKVPHKDGKAQPDRAVWWPSSVAKIVLRLDRTIVVRGSTRGARAGGSDFALARLLRCPTCGTLLTGTRDRGGKRVRYSCRLGTVTPHQRVTVSEHLILPAIQTEVGRLLTPEAVETAAHDGPERTKLEARRLRIVDLFEAGHIDRADRERRLAIVDEAASKLDARRTMLAVPRLDWTEQPRPLNAVLRALFNRIDLDPATFQPVGFEWAVPEWRA